MFTFRLMIAADASSTRRPETLARVAANEECPLARRDPASNAAVPAVSAVSVAAVSVATAEQSTRCRGLGVRDVSVSGEKK